MKKSTLSHLIGKSQHYVNIISKSRLFVDIFAMSSLISCYIDTSISSSLSHVRRDDVILPIHAISALRNDRVIATLKTTHWKI